MRVRHKGLLQTHSPGIPDQIGISICRFCGGRKTRLRSEKPLYDLGYGNLTWASCIRIKWLERAKLTWKNKVYGNNVYWVIV